MSPLVPQFLLGVKIEHDKADVEGDCQQTSVGRESQAVNIPAWPVYVDGNRSPRFPRFQRTKLDLQFFVTSDDLPGVWAEGDCEQDRFIVNLAAFLPAAHVPNCKTPWRFAESEADSRRCTTGARQRAAVWTERHCMNAVWTTAESTHEIETPRVVDFHLSEWASSCIAKRNGEEFPVRRQADLLDDRAVLDRNGSA